MQKAVLGTGIIFFVFSAFYYFYLIPTHIVFSLPLPQKGISTAALQPHFLPRILIVLFALMSILLIAGALHQQEAEGGKGMSARAIFQVGGVFVLCFAYVYAQELVGFIASTPFFMAVLMVFLGMRDWRYVASVAILFPLAVNYFFWFSFQVILPEGSLW